MILGILTLITALGISAVAIYYSVAGLMTIFAAAAIPIMIMGGALEIGKLVTAVWLHRYWKQATWWLKTYLTTAVVVLMFITSMGIFGFLSKAHIEQTAATTDNLAQIETLQSEIDRQIAVVGRAENRIRQLESSEVGADANVQSQIDKEQERIDSAYDRVQPAIQEQNAIIAGVTSLFQQELDRIDQELERLQTFIDNDEIERAQAMVGTAVDGDYGPATARAFQAFQDDKRQERTQWLEQIQNAAQSPTVLAAREEIARLRAKAEQQIADSNTLINRLRDQLGNTTSTEQIQTNIDEQAERVRTASSEIDRLTEEKIALESEYRKLEAEVGPIKYIAEFIYGQSADNNMLEEAVRWVIIIIIFVFDPLAVLLLIASQYTFEFNRKRKDDDGDRLRQWREYEQTRAQAIVDNPGFTPNDPVSSSVLDSDPIPDQKEERIDDTPMEEADADADATVRDMVSENNVSDNDETGNGVEQTQVQSDGLTPDEVARDYSEVEPVEKKDSSSVTKESTAVPRLTEEQLEELDQNEEWINAKQAWKAENPSLSLKFFKQMYLDGKIDSLPWEDYIVEKKSYIMKEGNNQVTLTAERTKPDLTEVVPSRGYIQNEEQETETSIWKNIRGKDE